MRRASGLSAARTHRLCQLLQHGNGLRHADAGIGQRHPMRQRLAFHDVLAAFAQMAFNHHPGDALITRRNLLRQIRRHVDLAAVLLAAVGM